MKTCAGCNQECADDCFYKAWTYKGTTYYHSKCKECRKEQGRKYPVDKAKANERSKAYKRKLRQDALAHYSGGTPKCAHCGNEDTRCLVLDHVNGDGNKHRKELKNTNIYAWAKANGYPPTLQVLCGNCNLIKAHVNGEWLKFREGQ